MYRFRKMFPYIQTEHRDAVSLLVAVYFDIIYP